MRAAPDSGDPPPPDELRARLADNLARVRAAIAAAARRGGRDPDAVRLIAVTKYTTPAALTALLELGVPDLGENQVQQLAARARAAAPPLFGWPPAPADDRAGLPAAAGGASVAGPPRPRWHMIGHLQRNKIKLLLGHARIIHSVDSVRLVTALAQHAADLAPAQPDCATLDVLLEVNVAGEATKEGVTPAELPALAAAARRATHLRLRGLMTMAPYDVDPEAARPHFARLRELLEELRAAGAVGPECVHLSMGMSQDYAVAVEEGATLVRVGSALFEGLPSADPRAAQ